MVNNFTQALTIGGSDSDGSAGIQADLLTFFKLGVHGCSVLTACVAGNSYGIHSQFTLPTTFITQELKDLAQDYNIKATKTGMLSDKATVDTIVKLYNQKDFGPLVVDPVIITKHGDTIMQDSAYKALVNNLIPLALVITPNFYESEKLSNIKIKSDQDIKQAALFLQKLGAKNIIIKGKHNDNNQTTVKDYVLLENGTDFWMSGPYYDTEHKNGTGDTLSAAITAELAKGKNPEQAIKIAKKYVDTTIKSPIEVGHKYGPVNHWG